MRDHGVGISHFICRDDQEREWLLDMNRRLEPQVTRAVAVLGLVLALCLPWFAPLSLVPFCVGAAMFGLGMQLTRRRQRMEPLVLAWFGAQLCFAAAIGIEGGEHDAGIALLLFPMLGACGGFPTRLVTVCCAYIAALMVAIELGIHGGVVVHDPPVLLVPIGMLLTVTIISSAVRQSSFEHRNAAVVDHLTGMLNRTALASRTHELAHQSTLTGQSVGVIVLDIDHFKEINDRHGHQKGDEVLRDLAYRLRKGLQAIDVGYRLGGVEFVILMPGATPTDATALARQLHASVRAEPLAGVPATISVGVASSPAGAAFDFDSVFFAADSALYGAKGAGRDQVRAATALPSPTGDLAPAAA
jgi:diguanylate cyclase (GGDEF)-like protein